jgi:hypothetical protein
VRALPCTALSDGLLLPHHVRRHAKAKINPTQCAPALIERRLSPPRSGPVCVGRTFLLRGVVCARRARARRSRTRRSNGGARGPGRATMAALDGGREAVPARPHVLIVASFRRLGRQSEGSSVRCHRRRRDADEAAAASSSSRANVRHRRPRLKARRRGPGLRRQSDVLLVPCCSC